MSSPSAVQSPRGQRYAPEGVEPKVDPYPGRPGYGAASRPNAFFSVFLWFAHVGGRGGTSSTFNKGRDVRKEPSFFFSFQESDSIILVNNNSPANITAWFENLFRTMMQGKSGTPGKLAHKRRVRIHISVRGQRIDYASTRTLNGKVDFPRAIGSEF